MNFKGKKILVVGLGISGQAAVRFLRDRGAIVTDTDQRRDGDPDLKIFREKDLIVISPGVPLSLPGLKEARRLRIPVLGEFGLAAQLLKVPIIAVTGTNGKSTTVTLITQMLEAGGKRVALAGNIGKPLVEVVMENKPLDWVVTEVSSYQLETVEKFHPKISVLLNITEDHLDRYDSFRQYAQAKFRIFKEQGPRDFLIYNEEDGVIRRAVRGVRAKKIGFSQKGFSKREYSLENVKLVGLHNRENMMASILVARTAGISRQNIQRVLDRFEGLPHRTQFVRNRAGVRYYDDSKGTNVDAVVKSLSDFPDKSVILIAGGRDKGGSYRPLRKMVKKKVKRAILIGEARQNIGKALSGVTQVDIMDGLEDAVPRAARLSKPGDVVLLSPACSSFDQFKDYKERGDLFCGLVKRL